MLKSKKVSVVEESRLESVAIERAMEKALATVSECIDESKIISIQ